MKRLQMLGEVIGVHEGKDMRPPALQIGIMEDVHGRILDGAVHLFGLAIHPRMIGLDQPMLDAELPENPTGDVSGVPCCRP
jgi:hypothetical protein